MDEEYKPKILIVDDSPTNLFAMEVALKSLDAIIVKAESGNEALSLTLRHNFAVVLLDVQMAEMDGFEVASLMQDDEATMYTPIIFVTAINKTEEYMFKGYESGAVDYLFKPVDPLILKGKVEVFLRLDRQKHTLDEMHRNLLQNERMAALGMIGAGVAHELNNPMMGILNRIEYVLDKLPQDDQFHDVLRGALEDVHQCIRIVQDLLSFVRGPEREGEAVYRDGDIHAFVSEALEMVEEDLTAAGMTVELDLDHDISRVMLDESAARQILSNLIKNARDAMAECSHRDLLIQTRDQGDNVAVVVRDTGSGMDEETRIRVFEPFFTTKPPGAGTGLGLTLCQNVLKMVDERIEVDSTLGRGSTFTLLIPKAKKELLSTI